jgi:AAA+ ATPase superfamily predicted ATPase
MKFYNREKELLRLRSIEQSAQQASKMTVIVGRRRIGKTRLVQEAFSEKVYFFVAKKNETLLCEEFCTIIENSLNIRIHGQFFKFIDLFEFLLDQSKQRPFTLVIDEFQEFLSINSGLYSDMQNVWDSYKEHTRLNLVLSGSVYSLMHKIFEDRKEPLFGRADHRIHLKPFTPATIKAIMQESAPGFSPDDLLSTYIFTGGVARYIEFFVAQKAFTLQEQLDVIFDEYSLFLEEGKNLLIEEFGKEYTTYFSILSLISASKTMRSEIEGTLGKNVGGYLDRLENEYTIIKKVKPIFARPGSRSVKYEIIDAFFNFWFRFIYKYKSAIEIENYSYVKDIVLRDYATYSGRFLERLIIEQLKESHDFSSIGTYWEKKNQNEIDIVALNEATKSMFVAEVKRNPQKLNMEKLKLKAQKIMAQHPEYSVKFKGYSLQDL